MEGLSKQLFDFISEKLTVMLTAPIPLTEVRGAIPVGLALKLGPWRQV